MFRKLSLVEGMPRKTAYQIIAKRYDVRPEMVASYIGPLTTEEKKQHVYSYDYRYKNIIRHVDNLLPQVFNGNPELSLKAISDGIDNLSGISLKEKTLEKLVGKYEGLPRGPPILKTESGNYRLNDLFYKN